MKRKFFFALLIILLFVSVPKNSVSGNEPEVETKNKKNAPIQIVSDRLDAYNKRRLVVFSGNVVATQEDKTIKSDKLYLYYKKREGESKKVGSKDVIKVGELDKAEAKGNVKITQGERIVTGETAVFYNDSQKAIVTGNPVMKDGDNVITGEKIIVLLEENRGIVESTPGSRVKATIYPKETEGEKK